MKKNTLVLVSLALLLVSLVTGCRRAKPAVVSDVQVVSTTTATSTTGRTVVPATSPSPTSGVTPEATRIPSSEAATSTPHAEATTSPTKAPTSTPVPTTAPTKTPTTVPTQVPTRVPTRVPTTAPSGERTHVVQPGENLFRIALYYGMSYESVAAANGIVNPDLIYVGQRLTIPAEGTTPTETTGTHVVQPGENLYRIALKYGITVEALAVANDISNASLIYPGQRLVIP